jgi:hypothetical protein
LTGKSAISWRFLLDLLRQSFMQQADRLQWLAQIMAGGGKEA